jgi:hypothetical protein
VAPMASTAAPCGPGRIFRFWFGPTRTSTPGSSATRPVVPPLQLACLPDTEGTPATSCGYHQR